MRRVLAAVVVALCGVGASSMSAAAGTIDEVADALRSDPVYVDPTAERALSEAESAEVRDAIRDAGTPVYIAVLPASSVEGAGGDAGELARQIAAALGRSGTVGVVAGDRFRAGSSELPAGRAGELASEALGAGTDDTATVLVEFVGLIGEAAAAGGGTGDGGNAGETSGGGDGEGSGLLLPMLLVGCAAGGGALWWRSAQRRRAEKVERQRAEEADRLLLRAELSVIADDVLRLEPQVLLHPEAQSDFDAAVNRYRAAQAAIDQAHDRVDLIRVQRVVDEAGYAMDRVRAVINGREPPPPPDSLRREGAHGEPALTLDDDRQPAYVGYPGRFNDGWYGGTGGGLFNGLLLGSLLGWGFGGWGHHTTIINEADGGQGLGDGGDFGGGDFGGGDFGGGDFGGGDFGGGDFGN